MSLVIGGGTNSPAPANSFFDTIIHNFLIKVGAIFSAQNSRNYQIFHDSSSFTGSLPFIDLNVISLVF